MEVPPLLNPYSRTLPCREWKYSHLMGLCCLKRGTSFSLEIIICFRSSTEREGVLKRWEHSQHFITVEIRLWSWSNHKTFSLFTYGSLHKLLMGRNADSPKCSTTASLFFFCDFSYDCSCIQSREAKYILHERGASLRRYSDNYYCAWQNLVVRRVKVFSYFLFSVFMLLAGTQAFTILLFL